MKRKKRVFSTALCLALSAGLLSGCGGQSGDAQGNSAAGGGEARGTQGAESAPEFVYKAEFIPLNGNTSNEYRIMDCVNDVLYTSTYEKTGEQTEEFSDPETGETVSSAYPVYTQKLYKMDLTGKLTPIPYEAPEGETTEDGKDVYRSLNSISVGGDGRVYLLEEMSTRWNDAPEGIGEDSEDYWNYFHYEQSYTLKSISPAGEMLPEISLDSLKGGEDSDGEEAAGFYISGMAADRDGNLVLAGEQKIYILDPTGTLKGSVEVDSWVDGCVRAGGDVYCGYYLDGKGMVLARVDTAAAKLDEPFPVKGDLYTMTSGGGDYDLYYSSGINFFGYSLARGESEKLFNWINVDLNAEGGGTAVTEDGRVVRILTEWDSPEPNPDGTYPEPVANNQLVIISKVPSASVSQKETLTLGTQFLDYNVRDAIIKFNRNSDKYRIEVKDYSEYNTEEDFSAGLTKLQTEVLSGVIPDLLDLTGLPLERFAAKGYLEDLYPWMEKDPELGRDALLPNVAKAMETDGKLYRTADSFTIQTVAGSSRVVGDKPGWTLKDYKAALAQMPEGCTPFEMYVTRDDMLNNMLSLEGDSFVNRATGECSFDSEAFVELLEFVNGFPKESPAEAEDFEWREEDEPPARIARGEQMLYSYYLYAPDSLIEVSSIFANNMTFIGYPVSEGVGSMFRFDGGAGSFAMSSACANKEAAWEFLRQFFTERYQDENVWRFPTNAKSFETTLKKAMEPQYERNADGSYVLDDNGNRKEIDYGSWTWAGVEIKNRPLSQADADQLRELVNVTTRTASYDDDIYAIVVEGAAPFFEGQRSAQEVAKQIQSKAMLYVNEQR